jgi:hypothetical protein
MTFGPETYHENYGQYFPFYIGMFSSVYENLNVPSGCFKSFDRSSMIFGGALGRLQVIDTSTGNVSQDQTALWPLTCVVSFASGAFQANDDSRMDFSPRGSWVIGKNYSNRRVLPAGFFTGYRGSWPSGLFVGNGNAVFDFGTRQGYGFNGDPTQWQTPDRDAGAPEGGAFFGSTTAITNPANLFQLNDNATVGNVSCAFYNAKATGTLPDWWNQDPTPEPHDACFYGNPSASNIADVPADWKSEPE